MCKILRNFLGTLSNGIGNVSWFRCSRMNRLPLLNSDSSQRIALRAPSLLFFSSSKSDSTTISGEKKTIVKKLRKLLRL